MNSTVNNETDFVNDDDDDDYYYNLQKIIFSFGSIVSVLCSILVLRAWYLMPQWRSLQNYISMNQVIFGTCYVLWWLGSIFSQNIIDQYFDIMNPILLSVNVCWSFNAIVLAYLRLVLLFNGKISREKRLATALAFGMTAVFVILGEITQIQEKENDLKVMKISISIKQCLMIVMTLTIALFVKIVLSVMSCGRKKMSIRSVGHVTSLVGVAVLGDVHFIAYLVWDSYIDFSHDIKLFITLDVLDATRVIPLTVITLLNRSSREHWNRYRQRRNRLALAKQT